MRQGGWQTRIGHRVAGKTLGLLGLGRLGSAVARVGLAFNMKAIAWSQNLPPRRPPSRASSGSRRTSCSAAPTSSRCISC